MRDVSRAFGEVAVLRGCTFAAEPGDIVALHGPNGSGKTTALRILAGVLAADAGDVTVCGERPGRGSAAYVPSGDRMLHWRLTGADDLRFYASLVGTSRDDRRPASLAAAEALGALHLLDRVVGECSAGQRRRLMIAASIVTASPVLLLDEPFSDLDRPGKNAVEAACAAWAEHGGVVVFSAPERSEGPSPSQAFEVVDGRFEATT